ncbi:VRR-NUC domain-containing protein [Vreelandella titanicae]|uniref:VRR-NUC domain-containing protein n=1 Tax=Vreelandella titanicae TaxID=664683 RepID=UPI004044DDF5
MTTSGLPASKRRPRKINANGAPRKRPVDWEGNEQAVLIRWLLGEKMRGEPVGALHDVTFHPPNGGVRSYKTAAAMKRQGAKAGVSDLKTMNARGGWFGLCIEFKASPPHTAALADSQRDWLALMESEGYCAVLAIGLEEAKRVLREYASWPHTSVHKGERMTMTSGTDRRKGQ